MTEATPRPRIAFWFEFGSSYSYPAALRIEALAREHAVEVEWRPFLLGPIFRSQGWDDSPFNLYEAKGRYMWHDLERTCSARRLAFKRPSVFPRNGLLAARVACCFAHEPWLPDFVRAIFHANFALDRDIAHRDEVARTLDDLNQPAPERIDAADREESKARLRAQTARAADLGIFGAPSFMIGDELFWGNDRLEDALQFATGN